MKTLPTFLSAALLALLACGAAPAGAASAEFGDYTVHYIAVNSTFLDADIARQYGITRGRRRAFLNISVLKNDPESGASAVTAAVSGSRNNLLQQSESIDFIEVKEGEAVYYIGQFEFSNAEQLRFELNVQPEGQGPTYPLQWSTKLYINQ